MKFKHISVSNLRNISDAQMTPGSGVNIIWGGNGSGKTSLLETIFLFGRGISFREKGLKSIIQNNKDILIARGTGEKSGKRIEVGIQKSAGKTTVKLNGDAISKLSILAKEVPVQVITPNVQYLFEREPVFRRRLLDWGLFHVEPGYQELSSRYRRTLLQRNIAIRRNDPSFTAWDPELSTISEKIDILRSAYIEELFGNASEIVSNLLDTEHMAVHWKSGWDREIGILTVLRRNRESDIKRGYTQAGAHRGDFSVKLSGGMLSERGSRGESKLIAIALILAQNSLIARKIKASPVLLIDDLSSELDQKNLAAITTKFSGGGGLGQVFITTTYPEMSAYRDLKEAKMFHVEHGVVSEVGV
jgi:DNA replication and repair protein RecF